MLPAILKRFNSFKTTADHLFGILLEKDFSLDLALATGLTAIPMEERAPEQNVSVGKLMGTYRRHGDCPSHLFRYASRKLQEEYRVIHDKICGVLYKSSQ